ncbi:hypothetical protein TKK_0010882 [Trichogramma kaykai]
MQAVSAKENFKDWDKTIKTVEMCLNTSFNKSTNKTPFELLYGYKHRYNEGMLRCLTVNEESADYHRPEQLQNEAREAILKEQTKTYISTDTIKNTIAQHSTTLET